MPVNISGTTLGQSTKDATALPGDVAIGKIFYNASGRSIGSMKPIKYTDIYVPNNTEGTSNTPVSYTRAIIHALDLTFSANNNGSGSGNYLSYNAMLQHVDGKICFCKIITKYGELSFSQYQGYEILYICKYNETDNHSFAVTYCDNTVYYMNCLQEDYPVTLRVYHE